MPEINKLVRDKIPEIIKNDGRNPVIKVLESDEYKKQLKRKLQEEVAEYLTDQNTSELADILEVVYALASEHGTSHEQLEQIRQAKQTQNGGFKNRIFLVEIK